MCVKKVERHRLTFLSSFSVLFGKPAEFDPARLIWVNFQTQLLQPFSEILQETSCVGAVLIQRRCHRHI
jgi:hypothetical protein